MNQENLRPVTVTRRHFFEECGIGVGKIALAALLGEAVAAGSLQAKTLGASPESSDLFAPGHPTSPQERSG